MSATSAATTAALKWILNSVFAFRNELYGATAPVMYDWYVAHPSSQGSQGSQPNYTLDEYTAIVNAGAKRGMWFKYYVPAATHASRNEAAPQVTYLFNRAMVAQNYANRQFGLASIIDQLQGGSSVRTSSPYQCTSAGKGSIFGVSTVCGPNGC